MKKLITFSSLCSSSLGSQSSDVSLDRRLTVGSPSGNYRSSLLQFASVLVLLFIIGVGDVWGTLSSPYECIFSASLSLSDNKVTTGDVQWTVSTTTGKGSPTIAFGNQNSQPCIKFGSGKNNYYSKMTLTTSAFSSYNVSSVVIYASSNNGGSKTFKVTQGATQIGTGSQSFSSTTWVTNITRSTTSGSGGDLSIEISSDATATFVHSIKVTYSAPSCTVTPTVGSSLTSVSATVSSITATVPISAIGGCNITENGLVYSTTNSTPTVGGTNCTKVTTTACGSTAANKTVTITGLTCGTSYYVRGYATNAAGTSYTNVTTQSTSACPLYTVTLMDDSDTRTQASAGASVTLPSRAGCSGYTFAGWTKSWATAQTSWTTTAPTIIEAGSYTPTANENLYPVYTKTEGGGSSNTYELITDADDLGNGDHILIVSPAGTVRASSTDYNYNAQALSTTVAGSTRLGGTDVTISSNTITTTTASVFTLSGNSSDGYKISSGGLYLYGTAKNGMSTTATAADALVFPITIAESSPYKATIGDVTLGSDNCHLDFNPSVSSGNVNKYFALYTSNYKGVYIYKETNGSTTSYISVPNCCTPLGAINGSVTWSSGPVATLIWDKDANASNYVVKWKTHAGGEGTYSTTNVSDIDDYATNKKKCSVTGLTAGTDYDFKIFITGKTTPSVYCDKDFVMTSTAIVVTVLKQDEAGTAISDAGVTATASGRTLTASAGSTNYLFKGWKYDTGADAGTTIDDDTSENTTLNGTPTGNVIVIAEFYKPRTIVWKVNNTTYTPGTPGTATTRHNTAWSALTLPTDPDVSNYCGQKFVGWTTTDMGESSYDKDDDADAIEDLDLMTSENQSTKTEQKIIDATTTFHAVFADYDE